MNAPDNPGCIEHVISLPRPARPVLAVGAWYKNTLCIASGLTAQVSRTVGDLDSPDACRAHEQIARELIRQLGDKPTIIAHDLHPDFYSTRYAAQLAAELGSHLLAVQHHHAHIAAICVVHGVEEPVLGLALDGVGYGVDGGVWGGELLKVEGAEFERIGHMCLLPLPGGDRAAREPWRMAAAVLHELGRGSEITSRFAGQAGAAMVAGMLQRGLNCPPASSMGRAFDAAAGLLGLCSKMEFEAQAAIVLEQAAVRYVAAHGMPQSLAGGWQINSSGQLDLLPLFARLADISDAEQGAAIFHATLIAALAGWAAQAAERTGIKIVACGGGCFLNNLLATGLSERLESTGLKALMARQVKPGDTAIALGQAWVALHSRAIAV
ncbi:MAG: carbamoyltransferase HypF [Gallionellaceae bacterium]|nr:carbamoyltransferase HypF [Gallionellaceae bacterium]